MEPADGWRCSGPVGRCRRGSCGRGRASTPPSSTPGVEVSPSPTSGWSAPSSWRRSTFPAVLPFVERYFRIAERGTTTRTEVRGGLATFFTMAYIVVLNPIILSGAADKAGNHLPLAQVATSTALVAAVMTIAMGVFGRYPFALAAGLGLNGVVAFSLATQMSWPAAMGIVVLEGLAITFLVLTGFREAVFDAIPMVLKQAISVGIGLFIAFIGFVDAGFVRRNAAPPVPVSL